MKNTTEPIERLLVMQLVEGNEKAYRKLYDTYRNDLYRFSLSMVVSKSFAEEIVQDVFLKLWMSFLRKPLTQLSNKPVE